MSNSLGVLDYEPGPSNRQGWESSPSPLADSADENTGSKKAVKAREEGSSKMTNGIKRKIGKLSSSKKTGVVVDDDEDGFEDGFTKVGYAKKSGLANNAASQGSLTDAQYADIKAALASAEASSSKKRHAGTKTSQKVPAEVDPTEPPAGLPPILHLPAGTTPTHLQFIVWFYILTKLHPNRITDMLNAVFETEYAVPDVINILEQFPQSRTELPGFTFRLRVPDDTCLWWNPRRLSVDETWMRDSTELRDCAIPPGVFQGVDIEGSFEWCSFVLNLRDGPKLVADKEREAGLPTEFIAPLVRERSKYIRKNRYFRTFFIFATIFGFLRWAETTIQLNEEGDPTISTYMLPILPFLWIYTFLIQPFIYLSERSFPADEEGATYIPRENTYTSFLEPQLGSLVSNDVLPVLIEAFVFTAIVYLTKPTLRYLVSRLGLRPPQRLVTPLVDIRTFSSDPIPVYRGPSRFESFYLQYMGIASIIADALILFAVAYGIYWSLWSAGDSLFEHFFPPVIEEEDPDEMEMLIEDAFGFLNAAYLLSPLRGLGLFQ